MIDPNATLSKTDNPDIQPKRPVIKTDLVVPFKALEIYRDRIIKNFNARLEVAHRDLKDCAKHKNDRAWDNERHEIETRIFWLKKCKGDLYISKVELESLHSREFYFTRELREPQKKSFAWRNQVLLRDNFTCKRCGIHNDLEAHHIYSYKYEPDLRYDINNGTTLCSYCHKEFHRQYGALANMGDLIVFLGVSD